MFLAMFGVFLDLLNHLSDIFNSDDGWQLNQDTEINIPEMTLEIDLDDEPSTFLEQDLLIHDDTSSSEHMRFGQSYEDSLSYAKSQLDADRILVNREQAEVDNAHFRLNSLSDRINHETNENLFNAYQSEMSFVESELTSHQRKLEQARADLAIHQQAEYDAEDKLREALNKES